MAEGASVVGISDLLTGLVMILVSIPLIGRRVGMNRWYGVRIPKAYASEANWYAINEVGGRWMAVAGGILATVGGIVLVLPPTTVDGLLFAALAPLPLLLFALVPVLRFARKLPS